MNATVYELRVLYLEVQDGAALRVVEGRGAVKEAEEERDCGGAGDDLEAVAPRKQSEIWGESN